MSNYDPDTVREVEALSHALHHVRSAEQELKRTASMMANDQMQRRMEMWASDYTEYAAVLLERIFEAVDEGLGI